MLKPDFSKFNNLSNNIKASDSEKVWREFLLASFNFVNHCSYKVNEDELSEITKSLQNWIQRRQFNQYKERNNVVKPQQGEIFLADLGLNFEFAYCHPVLILDEIENKLIVLPVTSSPDKVKDAFHPITNPSGLKRYRRVTPADGFDSESAIVMDELRIISKGRLLNKISSLNEDIYLVGSIFQEVIETSFSLLYSLQYQKINDMEQEIAELRDEIKVLKEKNHQV